MLLELDCTYFKSQKQQQDLRKYLPLRQVSPTVKPTSMQEQKSSQPKTNGKHICQRQAQRFPAAEYLPNICMSPLAKSARSQLSSPACSCRHGELVPRRHSLPTERARRCLPAPFTLCRRPGTQTLGSCLSVNRRAGCQFPGVTRAWRQGKQHGFVQACLQKKLEATSLEPAPLKA